MPVARNNTYCCDNLHVFVQSYCRLIQTDQNVIRMVSHVNCAQPADKVHKSLTEAKKGIKLLAVLCPVKTSNIILHMKHTH